MKPTARLDEATISEFAETQLLNYFWIAQPEQRLALLLLFTRVAIQRPAEWSPEAVRAAHQDGHHGVSPHIRVDKHRCFGCGAGATQLYAHHIIEVQNGGSNAVRNQVALCFDCHQYLHPWLTEEDRVGPSRRPGFESLAAIMARTIDVKEQP